MRRSTAGRRRSSALTGLCRVQGAVEAANRAEKDGDRDDACRVSDACFEDLRVAVVAGDVEAVRRWLKVYGSGAASAVDTHGWTALHHAAANNRHGAVVEMLLRSKVPINRQNDNRWTALHLAAYNSHRPTVEQLLQCGADRSLTDAADDTAADVAHLCNLHHIADYLTVQPQDTPPCPPLRSPPASGAHKKLPKRAKPGPRAQPPPPEVLPQLHLLERCEAGRREEIAREEVAAFYWRQLPCALASAVAGLGRRRPPAPRPGAGTERVRRESGRRGSLKRGGSEAGAMRRASRSVEGLKPPRRGTVVSISDQRDDLPPKHDENNAAAKRRSFGSVAGTGAQGTFTGVEDERPRRGTAVAISDQRNASRRDENNTTIASVEDERLRRGTIVSISDHRDTSNTTNGSVEDERLRRGAVESISDHRDTSKRDENNAGAKRHSFGSVGGDEVEEPFGSEEDERRRRGTVVSISDHRYKDTSKRDERGHEGRAEGERPRSGTLAAITGRRDGPPNTGAGKRRTLPSIGGRDPVGGRKDERPRKGNSLPPPALAEAAARSGQAGQPPTRGGTVSPAGYDGRRDTLNSSAADRLQQRGAIPAAGTEGERNRLVRKGSVAPMGGRRDMLKDHQPTRAAIGDDGELNRPGGKGSEAPTQDHAKNFADENEGSDPFRRLSGATADGRRETSDRRTLAPVTVEDERTNSSRPAAARDGGRRGSLESQAHRAVGTVADLPESLRSFARSALQKACEASRLYACSATLPLQPTASRSFLSTPRCSQGAAGLEPVTPSAFMQDNRLSQSQRSDMAEVQSVASPAYHPGCYVYHLDDCTCNAACLQADAGPKGGASAPAAPPGLHGRLAVLSPTSSGAGDSASDWLNPGSPVRNRAPSFLGDFGPLPQGPVSPAALRSLLLEGGSPFCAPSLSCWNCCGQLSGTAAGCTPAEPYQVPQLVMVQPTVLLEAPGLASVPLKGNEEKTSVECSGHSQHACTTVVCDPVMHGDDVGGEVAYGFEMSIDVGGVASAQGKYITVGLVDDEWWQEVPAHEAASRYLGGLHSIGWWSGTQVITGMNKRQATRLVQPEDRFLSFTQGDCIGMLVDGCNRELVFFVNRKLASVVRLPAVLGRKPVRVAVSLHGDSKVSFKQTLQTAPASLRSLAREREKWYLCWVHTRQRFETEKIEQARLMAQNGVLLAAAPVPRIVRTPVQNSRNVSAGAGNKSVIRLAVEGDCIGMLVDGCNRELVFFVNRKLASVVSFKQTLQTAPASLRSLAREREKWYLCWVHARQRFETEKIEQARLPVQNGFFLAAAPVPRIGRTPVQISRNVSAGADRSADRLAVEVPETICDQPT
ncbi:hypothetical protein DIPPA_06215 [Diplonema papillatum]|nr:hypothetical protein DIPPA_06215 [Diplonema papillatum]